MSIILNIEPKSKPQGTPKRGNPTWHNYYDWRNRFTSELCNKRLSFQDLPIPFEVRFYVSKGFSQKNAGELRNKRPDFDNYLKAFVDGWFGGFSKIDNTNYDDGIITGGCGFKVISPVEFIEILPAVIPDKSELLASIYRQLP